MDIDAEREKISKEIKELERILDPSSSSIPVDISESSLDSDSDAGEPVHLASSRRGWTPAPSSPIALLFPAQHGLCLYCSHRAPFLTSELLTVHTACPPANWLGSG